MTQNKYPDSKSFATRTVLALIALIVMGVVFVSLGRWQLSRAQERVQIAQSIEQGRHQAPIVLTPQTPQKDLIEWRTAQVTGQWETRYSVLLDNRNLDGRPGYWLATPLSLGQGEAVLVLRGWLPRMIQSPNNAVTADSTHTKPPFTLDTPNGAQSIVGEMTGHVPRLYDLGKAGPLFAAPESAFTEKLDAQTQTTLTQTDLQQLPVVQNLELKDMETVTRLRFLPIVLKQLQPQLPPQAQPEQTTASILQDGLVRHWAGPSIDADKNRGYAMQWFAFATIAFVAAGVLGWRSVKRAKISMV